MYQFHPHAASVRQLLENDYALHPEVRWSFENEIDSQPLIRQRAEALQEWEMADGILCASSFTKSSLVQQGCREDKIRVVPYGIFPDALTAIEQPQNRKICRFIFVGQGVQRKGLHHLLKAWKLASLKDAELVVVAKKLDPGLFPLMDQPNVKHYSGLSDQELKALYNEASIFVMPSLVEGFGLVYLEALAAGLHCIGTMNTGLPDLQLPSECASIVSIGDVQGLANVIVAITESYRRGEIYKERIKNAVKALTWDMRRSELRSVIAEMTKE